MEDFATHSALQGESKSIEERDFWPALLTESISVYHSGNRVVQLVSSLRYAVMVVTATNPCEEGVPWANLCP